jgi:ADP-ribose pyrophosphatase
MAPDPGARQPREEQAVNQDSGHLRERGLTQEIVYTGKIFRVRVDTVALPNGEIAQREIAEHPGASAIVPLTDDGQVMLARQFRYAIGQVSLEIPAGKLNYPGEDVTAVARRELKEETGCEAAELRYLGKLHSTPGFSNEALHLYVATGLHLGETQPDDDEFIEIVNVPLDAALEAIRRGEITDAKTIAALLWIKQFGTESPQTPPQSGTLTDQPTS